LPDKGVVGVHGEDQRPGFHFEVTQPADGLHPVQVRHGDVEHEDVGEEPLDQREGLRAVGCLPHHLDVAGLLQEGADPLADQVVIVGDDDADHGTCPAGAKNSSRSQPIDRNTQGVAW